MVQQFIADKLFWFIALWSVFFPDKWFSYKPLYYYIFLPNIRHTVIILPQHDAKDMFTNIFFRYPSGLNDYMQKQHIF